MFCFSKWRSDHEAPHSPNKWYSCWDGELPTLPECQGSWDGRPKHRVLLQSLQSRVRSIATTPTSQHGCCRWAIDDLSPCVYLRRGAAQPRSRSPLSAWAVCVDVTGPIFSNHGFLDPAVYLRSLLITWDNPGGDRHWGLLFVLHFLFDCQGQISVSLRFFHISLSICLWMTRSLSGRTDVNPYLLTKWPKQRPHHYPVPSSHPRIEAGVSCRAEYESLICLSRLRLDWLLWNIRCLTVLCVCVLINQWCWNSGCIWNIYVFSHALSVLFCHL